MGAKIARQNRVEEDKPDREHVGFDIARGLVHRHWVAVIGALEKDRVAPEGGDLRFMGRPIRDVPCENGAKQRVFTYLCVEARNDSIYLCG